MMRGVAGVFLMCGIAVAAETRVVRGANVTTGCVDRFDPAIDYFPDRLAIEDALTFSVEYHKSYKLVTIKEAYARGPRERYVLVQCGTATPRLVGDLAGAQAVTVPLASLFVMSTTHLSLLADLDRIDVLTALARQDVVMNAQAEARIKAGSVIEFAKAGPVDVERVITVRPSLLMTGGTSNAAFAV